MSAPDLNVDLHIDLSGPGDLTTRLYQGLRAAVLDGRLRSGDRLPASRLLATRLAVSRGTVSSAYERLVAEGFLTATVGAGTFVAQSVPSVEPVRRRRRSGAVRPRPDAPREPAPVGAEGQAAYDFRVGVPDATLFPFDTWRRLVTAELRAGANSPGRYADPAGDLRLRAAIARHIGVARSVRADPEDVLVTNGTQQALDLLARVLLSPGDTVVVENPGYPPAAALFASLGMRVVPVPVDGEGLVVDRLPDRARLVYVTPSHQFPTGTALSLARRVALTRWADDHDVAIVEDDYDSEFRFTSRPLEPLVNLDPSGRVCYVGSFSKTMLPTVRLGFVVAPPSLRSALRAARQLSDGFSAPTTQVALARFLDEGLFARHVRRAAGVYARRHDQVRAALWDVPGLDVVPSSAGLHVCGQWTDAPPGTGRRVVDAARRRGVAVESLADYDRLQSDGSSSSTPAEGVVVGYGAIPSELVPEGLHRLVREARAELAREPRRARTRT